MPLINNKTGETATPTRRRDWKGMRAGEGFLPLSPEKIAKRAAHKAKQEQEQSVKAERAAARALERAELNEWLEANFIAREALISNLSIVGKFESDHTLINLAFDPATEIYYVLWASTRQKPPRELSPNWNVLTIQPTGHNEFRLIEFGKPRQGEPEEQVRGEAKLVNPSVYIKIDGRPWIKMRAPSIQPTQIQARRDIQRDDEQDEGLTQEDLDRLQSTRDLHSPRIRG